MDMVPGEAHKSDKLTIWFDQLAKGDRRKLSCFNLLVE